MTLGTEQMTEQDEWRKWCQEMSRVTASDNFISGIRAWTRDILITIIVFVTIVAFTRYLR